MSAHRDIRGVITGGLLAGALLLTIAAPALGQNQDYDARWLPWLGCWEPVTGPADSDAPMLCLRPLAEGEGVEMLTVVDGEIASQETIRADGINRQTSREGCDGWERTSFSDDGRRIYLRADFVCEGGVERRSAGLMSMVSPYEWLDVRTVEVAGESVPWVLRYQLATLEAVEAVGLEGIAANRTMAQQTARIAASSALTMEAIVDVSSHMDAKAVEAWIVEHGDQFALDAGRLVAMADADVPESVIDIVVAVSYPEQFVVDRNLEGGADVAESEYTRTGRYGRSGRVRYGCGRYYDPLYYDPFFLSPFYSPYAGCSYYSPYRYGFGYNLGYGGFGFGYGTYGTYRPTIVVVGRRQQESPGRPRAVRGRGYTRGLGSGSSSSGGVRPRGSAAGSSSRGAMGASRSGSSSPGSSTGRSAKPRGGRTP